METIIKHGNEFLKKNPTTYLKVNSIFKGMGFKEVNIYYELKENHFCNELTLFITPSNSYISCNEFYVPDTLSTKWLKFAGYRNPSTLREITNYDEVEKIIIDGLHLGDYYKERNFVIFFYPIHQTNIDLGLKNDFLFYLLEEFSKEITRIKPKVVDVSKKMREELVNKFLKEIKKSLIGFRSKINDKLAVVEEARSKELKYLSEVKQLQEQIKILTGTYKAMGSNIESRIIEIKKLPFVKRVGISNLGIRVDFNHIDLEWENEKVPLGECYAYLNPNKLEIKNKNFVKYGGTIYHSPHISDTSVCFGNGKDKAYELLASLKFKELVYFIYLYLKTYNVGDTYLSLSNWEKCKKNGGEWDGSDDEEDNESRAYDENGDPL